MKGWADTRGYNGQVPDVSGPEIGNSIIVSTNRIKLKTGYAREYFSISNGDLDGVFDVFPARDRLNDQNTRGGGHMTSLV